MMVGVWTMQPDGANYHTLVSCSPHGCRDSNPGIQDMFLKPEIPGLGGSNPGIENLVHFYVIITVSTLFCVTGDLSSGVSCLRREINNGLYLLTKPFIPSASISWYQPQLRVEVLHN
jgi:hypothetical protein